MVDNSLEVQDANDMDNNQSLDPEQQEKVEMLTNFALVLNPYADAKFLIGLDNFVIDEKNDFKRIVHAHLLSDGSKAHAQGWDINLLKAAVKESFGFDDVKRVDEFVKEHFDFRTFEAFIKAATDIASVNDDGLVLPHIDASNKEMWEDAVASVKNKEDKARRQENRLVQRIVNVENIEGFYQGVNRLKKAIEAARDSYRSHDKAFARIDKNDGTGETVEGVNYNYVCTEYEKLFGKKLDKEESKLICGRSTLNMALTTTGHASLKENFYMQQLNTEPKGMFIAVRAGFQGFSDEEIKAAIEEYKRNNAEKQQAVTNRYERRERPPKSYVSPSVASARPANAPSQSTVPSATVPSIPSTTVNHERESTAVEPIDNMTERREEEKEQQQPKQQQQQEVMPTPSAPVVQRRVREEEEERYDGDSDEEVKYSDEDDDERIERRVVKKTTRTAVSPAPDNNERQQNSESAAPRPVSPPPSSSTHQYDMDKNAIGKKVALQDQQVYSRATIKAIGSAAAGKNNWEDEDESSPTVQQKQLELLQLTRQPQSQPAAQPRMQQQQQQEQNMQLQQQHVQQQQTQQHPGYQSTPSPAFEQYPPVDQQQMQPMQQPYGQHPQQMQSIPHPQQSSISLAGHPQYDPCIAASQSSHYIDPRIATPSPIGDRPVISPPVQQGYAPNQPYYPGQQGLPLNPGYGPNGQPYPQQGSVPPLQSPNPSPVSVYVDNAPQQQAPHAAPPQGYPSQTPPPGGYPGAPPQQPQYHPPPPQGYPPNQQYPPPHPQPYGAPGAPPQPPYNYQSAPLHPPPGPNYPQQGNHQQYQHNRDQYNQPPPHSQYPDRQPAPMNYRDDGYGSQQSRPVEREERRMTYEEYHRNEEAKRREENLRKREEELEKQMERMEKMAESLEKEKKEMKEKAEERRRENERKQEDDRTNRDYHDSGYGREEHSPPAQREQRRMRNEEYGRQPETANRPLGGGRVDERRGGRRDEREYPEARSDYSESSNGGHGRDGLASWRDEQPIHRGPPPMDRNENRALDGVRREMGGLRGNGGNDVTRPIGTSTPMNSTRSNDATWEELRQLDSPEKRITNQIVEILHWRQRLNSSRPERDYELLEINDLFELVERGCGDDMEVLHACNPDGTPRDLVWFVRRMEKKKMLTRYKSRKWDQVRNEFVQVVYVSDPFTTPPDFLQLTRASRD